MSSYYGVIFPEFWTGPTGREIRALGGRDAQLLALYLTSNRHANMIGLYRLLLDDIHHETGLPAKAIVRSAPALSNFAAFDTSTAFVWVFNMARFRLGLKVGTTLDPDDKRVIAANRIYQALDGNPFLGDFFDRNRLILRLKKRRDAVGVVVALGEHHNMSGFEGAYQGASKPDTEIRSRDQIQKQKKARRAAPPNLRQNERVIGALIADVLRRPDLPMDYASLKDVMKEACATHDIAYDAEVVANALEQAMARRRKAS